jgi:hypothetical protein
MSPPLNRHPHSLSFFSQPAPPPYERTQASSTSGTSEQSEQSEQAALRNLEQRIIEYRGASAPTQADAVAVYDAMNVVGNQQKSVSEKRRWRQKARRFMDGDDKEKDNVLLSTLKLTFHLCKLPFVIAGGLLIATGSLLQGMGHMLSGGSFDNSKRKLQRTASI